MAESNCIEKPGITEADRHDQFARYSESKSSLQFFLEDVSGDGYIELLQLAEGIEQMADVLSDAKDFQTIELSHLQFSGLLMGIKGLSKYLKVDAEQKHERADALLKNLGLVS